jgi:hypothetical protein
MTADKILIYLQFRHLIILYHSIKHRTDRPDARVQLRIPAFRQ